MKKRNKKAQLRRKKEFRFKTIKVVKNGRKKKIQKHPAYVFLQKGNIFIYVLITHSGSVDNYTVIKLRKNPNPNDDEDSFYVAEVKEEKKDSFGKIVKKWKMDEQDDYDIRDLYKNKNR